MEGIKKKLFRWDILVEAATWIIMIGIIFGFHFLPNNPLGDDITFIMVGVIIAFALLYYFVITKYLQHNQSESLKIIADVVFIGILIYILKDYGQYMFALYFIPIAAAALSLEFFNALIIAMIACIFVALELILSSQGLLPQTINVYQGIWQIALILLITIFCRALAMQLRQERVAKEEAETRQKVLEEESIRQKEFLSLTSHQLYTPLSMIRGFISMLDDGHLGKLNSNQQNAIGQIYSNTKRMIGLVKELLNISRIQSGTFEVKMTEGKIEDLTEDIVKQFLDSKLSEDTELIYKKPKNFVPIHFDEDKIRNVIYNLIDNALKYTVKGKVEIKISQKNNFTTLTVSDQGIGIKDEDIDKLFQPFFRGQNILELDNQGTGLGLYIARLIVEKHGGKIWAENNPTKGATFAFSIPN